jgi:hypothetical protein
MTVRTHDIALRDFIEKFRHAHSTCDARDLEFFRARIPMIEVHHVRRIALTAVDAWDLAEHSNERDLFRHAFPGSSEKLLAVRFVEPAPIFSSVSISTMITAHPGI